MIKNNHPYPPGTIEKGVQSLRGTQSPLIPTKPLHVPLGQRQLIMSRCVMEDYYDCTRTVHAVEKHPDNPLISSEHPWEQEGPTANGSVIFDEETGKYRMWTQIWNYPPSGDKHDRDFHAIYYESDDGIEWTRPNLGQHAYDGSADNNLVDIGAFMPSVVHVFKLPKTFWDRGRYGMVMAGQRDERSSKDEHRAEQFLLFSEDGNRWTPPADNFFSRSL